MPRTPATPDPAPTSRGRRASRVLGTIVAAGAMFASTALIAPAAWAECTVQNRYTAVEGGYWVAFEALFVPPATARSSRRSRRRGPTPRPPRSARSWG